MSFFRDNNILPYDHNRIKLMDPIDGSDYVNASLILLSNYNDPDRASLMPNSVKVSFIASQGPTIDTCVHHLQMIHEQEVDVVIMLTKAKEALGKTKRPLFDYISVLNKIYK